MGRDPPKAALLHPLAWLMPASIPGRASHRPHTQLHPNTPAATQQTPLPGSANVLGHYGQAELGTDTCHAGLHVGISVSPILSFCPCDAGGSIPGPFSLLQCDGSSMLLTAQHGRQPCDAVPSRAMPCRAMPRCVTLCCPQTPLQTPGQSSLKMHKAMCPWHAPSLPTPQPRLRLCPGRAGGTGPFPATCPCGPVVGETILQGHHLSQTHSCRC